MALAICPAPFQSKRKASKGPKKGAKSATTVQAVIPVADEIIRHIAQFDDPRSRQPQQPQQYSPAGYRPGAPRPAPQAPATRPSPQRPRYDQHDGHFACQNDSQQSFDSHCTRASSGYHSSSGYQSDEASFESKMLSRATKERPANLRMTAARDYAPCSDEELQVMRGQRVHVLYKVQDWVFAMTKSGDCGYLPYSYVRPSRKYGGYQSEPEYTQDIDYASGYDTDIPLDRSRAVVGHRTHQIGDVSPMSHVPQGFRRVGSGSPRSVRKPSVDGYLSAVEEYPSSSSSYMQQPRPAKSLHSIIDSSSPKSHRPAECKPEADSFVREFIEELVVIHSFDAKEEDEIVVSKGEKVQVLNADDPSWLWVKTLHGDEGFIPRSCCALGNHPLLHSNTTRTNRAVPPPARQPRSHRYYQYQQAKARHAREQVKHRFNELAKMKNLNPETMSKEEIVRTGTTLIVLTDYTPTERDELEVVFAEPLFANILTQSAGAERMWAYCPRTGLCGYVPASLVAPQVV